MAKLAPHLRRFCELVRDLQHPGVSREAEAILRADDRTAGLRRARRSALAPSLRHHDRVLDEQEAAQEEAKRVMHDAVWKENLLLSRDSAAPFGRCDCGCGGRFSSLAEGECDHWIERSQGGGHTRANGWRLLPKCHRAKTDNRPARAEWNLRRRAYCGRAGIPFVHRRER